MNQDLVPWEGRPQRFPPLRGEGSTLTKGAKVRVRGDRKIYTVTGVSYLSAGIVLTLEHQTLITREYTLLHTSYLNVDEVVTP